MSAATLRRRSLSPRRLTRIAISYGVLLLVTVIVSLPVFWFVVTTLKKDSEYLSYPIKILPAVPQWDNYVKVFTTGGFSFTKYAGHSLFLAVTNTVLIVLTSSMAGFAFSRLHGVPGRNELFMVVIALFIIPGSVYLIPQFIVYSRLHLTDTYWPWILGGLGASPFFIFLFRQFFSTFPKELEDAAEVDGCGPFRVFWQIFLPNAKPALATAVIFNFSGVWGDYITPLIYLSDAKTTLSVKLAGAYMTPHGEALTTVTLAANLVFALPLVIIFFLGQKYILKGVVTSGLKG